MMVATAAQMKELDRQAIEEYGIPSLDLMEHAAQAVANEVRELLKGYKNPLIGGAVSAIIMGSSDTVSEEKRAEKEQEHQRLQTILDEKKRDKAPWVGVLCGPGNNGGDGVAAARILMGMGCRVRAFLVGDRAKMSRDQRAMAEKLAQVSRRKQVLCVTHLPQLAAMADTHFSVEKGERDGRTYTRVVLLDREQRKAELARITGGSRVTEALLASAGELLDQAERYRSELGMRNHAE